MTTMELIERGIGHNCLSDAYELGRADMKREIEEHSVFYSNRPIEDIMLEARNDAIDEYKNALHTKYKGEKIMDRCDICKHQDSCVCVPYGCENFKINLSKHDAKVRADAIDEFVDAITCLPYFTNMQKDAFRIFAEQLKEKNK